MSEGFLKPILDTQQLQNALSSIERRQGELQSQNAQVLTQLKIMSSNMAKAIPHKNISRWDMFINGLTGQITVREFIVLTLGIVWGCYALWGK